MSVEYKGQSITMVAAADFSAKQYYIVKVDSSGYAALATAQTDQPIGILQSTAASGGAVEVMISGVSKCIGGAALSIGDQIGSDANGKGTATTLAAGGTVYNYVIGRVLTASAAASGLAEVLIYPGGLPVLVS